MFNRCYLLTLSILLFLIISVRVFSVDTEIVQIEGEKICREAQGPDDTSSFQFVLLKDNTITGSGSFTGATGLLELSSGTWEKKGSIIEIILIYKGKQYGEKGSGKGMQKITVRIPVSDLINDKSDCFNFTDPL